MPFVFANPAGFWALLGIPAILLIHFLQRQSQTLSISTLFLLERIERQSLKGRKIDRLRNSIPLWLQLLCVLVLTWLLTEPRWLSGNAVHPVVFVVDSSASMAAFQEETEKAITGEASAFFQRQDGIALTVMESHPDGETLFSGASDSGLSDAIGDWQPSAGAHSSEETLRVGRSIAGSEGTLIFVTDHTEPSPEFGAKLLSVGSEIENVGFAGFLIDTSGDEPIWRTTVRNYSTEAQTRNWFAAFGGQRSSERSIALEAGETRTLSGAFPAGSDRIQIALEPDRFERDDTLYLVVPRQKPLLTRSVVAEDVTELTTSIIESLENAPLSESDETPDLWFATYNPLQPTELPDVAVIFLNQESVPKEFFQGAVVASNHPLVENLNWQGLIARSTPSLPIAESDTALVWQGDHPLAVLRERPGTQQLIFNFDVAHSNAARLPAFVVMIHRFADRIRERKIAPVADNVDLRQPLTLALDRTGGSPGLTLTTGSTTQTISPNRASFLRAPRIPGFFRVEQGDQLLLDGAANFADTREADFSRAGSFSDVGDVTATVRKKQTRADPVWQIWLVGVAAIVLLSWWMLRREENLPSPSQQG